MKATKHDPPRVPIPPVGGQAGQCALGSWPAATDAPPVADAAAFQEEVMDELIAKLGENAAKAAGEYAANIAAMREALHLCASRFQVASVDAMQAGDTRLSVQCITWANDATRAALTEPTDG